MNFYVYFIQEDKVSKKAPVKIGVSNDPEARLATFQTGNPRLLVIRSKIGPLSEAEAFELERRFHLRFKECRIRGEWFTGKVLTRMHRVRESPEAVAIREFL